MHRDYMYNLRLSCTNVSSSIVAVEADQLSLRQGHTEGS